MDLSLYIAACEDKTLPELFGGQNPPIKLEAAAGGLPVVISWDETRVVMKKPTTEQIEQIVAGTLKPVPPLATLATSLVSAASGVCADITTKVSPDVTHQNAYVNASAWVAANGGAPPSADPMKTAFNALADEFGQTPQNFASMVGALAAVSLQLSASLAALEKSAYAASSVADLAVAATTFETTVSSIVTAVGATGVKITPPEAISITGINA
jgi:hypothetical protein